MNGKQLLLSKMQNDRIHGSSWYYDQATAYMEGSREAEIRDRLNDLEKIRPGMGSIRNVISSLRESIDEDDFKSRLQRLIEYKQKVVHELAENLSYAANPYIITISYSSAVLLYISIVRPKIVYLMESRPGYEYRNAYRMYSKYSEVRVIQDTMAYSFIQNGIPVVTGADGIFSSGYLVNKVGTAQVLACSKLSGMKSYVIIESYKASEDAIDEDHASSTSLQTDFLVRDLFERVPLDWLDFLVTDAGVFHNPDRSTILGMVDKFRGYVSSPRP